MQSRCSVKAPGADCPISNEVKMVGVNEHGACWLSVDDTSELLRNCLYRVGVSVEGMRK